MLLPAPIMLQNITLHFITVKIYITTWEMRSFVLRSCDSLGELNIANGHHQKQRKTFMVVAITSSIQQNN